MLEVNPEHNRNAKHILPVWDRVEDILFKVMTEDDYPLGLTGGTKATDFARKLKQKLVSTVGTGNSGESLLQVSTFQVGSHHFRDNGSKETIPLFESFFVNPFKGLKMPVQELP